MLRWCMILIDFYLSLGKLIEMKGDKIKEALEKYPFMDNLLSIISRDISILRKNGADINTIKVSIPRYVLEIIEGFSGLNSISILESPILENPSIKYIFGAEIVKGYNNQVCVFDDSIKMGDQFLDPIIIFPSLTYTKRPSSEN